VQNPPATGLGRGAGYQRAESCRGGAGQSSCKLGANWAVLEPFQLADGKGGKREAVGASDGSWRCARSVQGACRERAGEGAWEHGRELEVCKGCAGSVQGVSRERAWEHVWEGEEELEVCKQVCKEACRE